MVTTALLVSQDRAGAATGLGLDAVCLLSSLQGTGDFSCPRKPASALIVLYCSQYLMQHEYFAYLVETWLDPCENHVTKTD